MLLIIKKETKVAKVVTFANVKGGSGKSTLCINMAAILIRAGYSVAILDLDQQKCSQDWITGTKDKLLSRVISSPTFNFLDGLMNAIHLKFFFFL